MASLAIEYVFTKLIRRCSRSPSIYSLTFATPRLKSASQTEMRGLLEQEQPQNFDVLVIDAFSGDAVPLHLLTAEALAVYQRQLAPGGILAFHVSNQYVDLEPEVVLLARSAGMQVMTVASGENKARGEFFATWVLVTHNAEFFTLPEVASRASRPHENPKVRLWTDDYSSLLPLLRW